MDVVEITADLVSYNSASQFSNTPVSRAIARWLRKAGMSVELLNYVDPAGTQKTNVIGKKGDGTGGIALLAHSDVVPAEGWASDPFKLTARKDRLYGRGSADMKGSVACMIAAANAFSVNELKTPVYVIVTADEETDCSGAKAVASKSKIFKSSDVRYGIVGEPTLLDVVYAHKGSLKFDATARGKAAHSSTGKGENANHRLIPFLNDVVKLDGKLQTDSRYRNEAFDPPHGTLNIVFSDGDTAANVTAPVSRATINCRPMPDQNWKPIINRMVTTGGQTRCSDSSAESPRSAEHEHRFADRPGSASDRRKAEAQDRLLRNGWHGVWKNDGTGRHGSRQHSAGAHRGRMDLAGPAPQGFRCLHKNGTSILR